MSREDWVKQYSSMASAAAGDSGIYPGVILAAAILESSGKVNGVYEPGQSLLAKNYNNYFGIKNSAGWSGPTVTLTTGEYINGQYVNVSGTFRKYASVQDSFSDYVNFLKVNPRYRAAGVFSAANVDQQAAALQRAGYATDPQYGNKLISIYNSIKSYIIDNPGIIAAGGGGLFLLLVAALILYKQ
jgi:flagellar protein FlgJ